MNAQPCIYQPRPATLTLARHLMAQLEKPLTGFLLTLALGLTAASLPAQGGVVPAVHAQTTPVQANAVLPSQQLPDGVYLYGQSATADRLGSAYMIFEVRDRQLVGAFYMPQSSFDCFNGQLQDDRLALNITNSYEQTSYRYSVALEVSDPVASTQGQWGATSVSLEGFHPIASINETNYQILATCQTRYE